MNTLKNLLILPRILIVSLLYVLFLPLLGFITFIGAAFQLFEDYLFKVTKTSK